MMLGYVYQWIFLISTQSYTQSKWWVFDIYVDFQQDTRRFNCIHQCEVRRLDWIHVILPNLTNGDKAWQDWLLGLSASGCIVGTTEIKTFGSKCSDLTRDLRTKAFYRIQKKIRKRIG